MHDVRGYDHHSYTHRCLGSVSSKVVSRAYEEVRFDERTPKEAARMERTAPTTAYRRELETTVEVDEGEEPHFVVNPVIPAIVARPQRGVREVRAMQMHQGTCDVYGSPVRPATTR